MAPRPMRTRLDLEAELHFWRNYAALSRYSLKVEPPRIPSLRPALDDRWDDLVRRGLRARPNSPRRAR